MAELMANRRLDMLRSLVAQNPGDSRVRYMLAMELASSGDLESAAGEFEGLISLDPDYAYAYFHRGQALEKLGRVDEARQAYAQGIEAAKRKSDNKARDELQGALDLLG